MARKSVIFDLWGTLVPFPHALWRGSIDEMAALLGAAESDEFAGAWAAGLDKRSVGDLRAYLEEFCGSLRLEAEPAQLDEAVALRAAFHALHFRLRPDAVPTLRELRGRGVKLGLISDCTSEVPGVLASSPLAELLDATVFSCEVGMKKPDPRIYAIACEQLGVEPADCLYVGDGDSDELNGAARVGMSPVLLRAGDGPERDWDGPVISSLSEVPRLLDA